MSRYLTPIAMLGLLLSATTVQARDWFVRAGSAGDGTIEKPFKDPSLALEEASPGDTIHVAAGVYHGKLDAMAYDSGAALKIVPAKLKEGAHPLAIEVKPFAAAPAAATYTYEKATWQQLAETPASIDGKRVEITGVVGDESSTYGFPEISEADPACTAGARPRPLEVHFNQ